jgi:hypothetical protein
MAFSSALEGEEELKPILGDSEILLWSGRPKKGLVFRSSDIIVIPFSILWCGFAIFWEVSVAGSNGPVLFVLWGIPFVLIGLYLTIGRFYFDARKRGSTLYGISKERIIIKSGWWKPEIKSLNIRTLSDVTLNQRPDGSGTITLGPTLYWHGMMSGTASPGMKMPPCLELIPNAKEVFNLIMKNQMNA